MFYCEACAEVNDWPRTISRSFGTCEQCQKPAPCYDFPLWRLNLSEPQVQFDDDPFF